METDHDVVLAGEHAAPVLGYEEHLLKEKQLATRLRPRHLECSLQQKISVGGQVRVLKLRREDRERPRGSSTA